MSENTWDQANQSMNAARKKLLGLSMELGGEVQYGALLSDGSPDKWKIDLLGAELSAADKEVRALAYAMGIGQYIEGLDDRLAAFRADAQDLESDTDTDVLIAHQKGVMDALDCVETLLGERDPMVLYEQFIAALHRVNERPG